LSKIGFSLDSTWRVEGSDRLIRNRRKHSKPFILHVGQVFYPPQTTVADLLAFGQHFEVKDNLNLQSIT